MGLVTTTRRGLEARVDEQQRRAPTSRTHLPQHEPQHYRPSPTSSSSTQLGDDCILDFRTAGHCAKVCTGRLFNAGYVKAVVGVGDVIPKAAPHNLLPMCFHELAEGRRTTLLRHAQGCGLVPSTACCSLDEWRKSPVCYRTIVPAGL